MRRLYEVYINFAAWKTQPPYRGEAAFMGRTRQEGVVELTDYSEIDLCSQGLLERAQYFLAKQLLPD